MQTLTVTYGIVGTQHYDYQDIFRDLSIGDELKLVRQSDNAYDPRAVAVFHVPTGRQIGYVPKAYNELLSQMMDNGWKTRGTLIEHAKAGHSDQRMKVLIALEVDHETAPDPQAA